MTNQDGKSALRPAGFTYSRLLFLRGDASGDGLVNLADALATLEFLFRTGTLPSCWQGIPVRR